MTLFLIISGRRKSTSNITEVSIKKMNLFKIADKVKQILVQISTLSERIEDLQQAIGRIELRQTLSIDSTDIHANEFKVFSQNGEDGIIQFLINKIPIENKVFVEFGIGSYTECNTRFLLKHNNWNGLVIDGSDDYIQKLTNSSLYWLHNLKSECSFITKDNINGIISAKGITGDIGILSVDIDGNDYWIWEAINCISPRIVICEYNSLFGPNKSVTSLYDPNFVIDKAHFSGLYWGASIAAFDYLAKKKGYSLVGSNTTGNNIFFVRNDVVGEIPVYTPAQAHVESQFRISRNPDGSLSFLDRQAGLAVIADMSLYEVDTDKIIKVRDLEI
jgi:hypothetical protein